MLSGLRKEVCAANRALVKHKLVILTFGNVSGIDRQAGLVAIKPSGTAYDQLKPESIVLVDLTGKVVEGKLKPSVDLPTHLELYKAWPEIRGICHTHSPYAAAFAQAEKPIPCLGTTHADEFHGEIPVTRPLTAKEMERDYAANTGRVIVDQFRLTNPGDMMAVLVAKHGPFTWGKDALEAVTNSLLLEEIARLAFRTLVINPQARPLGKDLLDKHYLRKHGPNAAYGQK
jgi:L-ribulose-5-phosphate 4-epimerase